VPLISDYPITPSEAVNIAHCALRYYGHHPLTVRLVADLARRIVGCPAVDGHEATRRIMPHVGRGGQDFAPLTEAEIAEAVKAVAP
jgi:hypothetical protein